METAQLHTLQDLAVLSAEERPDKAPATKTIEDSFREMTEGQ